MMIERLFSRGVVNVLVGADCLGMRIQQPNETVVTAATTARYRFLNRIVGTRIAPSLWSIGEDDLSLAEEVELQGQRTTGPTQEERVERS